MKYLVFFSFIISMSSAFDCPSSNWSCFRDKCYLTDISKYYTFQENVDYCDSQNATTVSIHSKAENTFINTTLLHNYGYWLGIRQVDFDNQTYAWLDGSVYNYSNWISRWGQKDCNGSVIFNGNWKDYKNCDDKNHAFCQITIQPTFCKMQSQINQLSEDLKQEIKDIRSGLNETNAKLLKLLNMMNASI